jgi:hypothetical protein
VAHRLLETERVTSRIMKEYGMGEIDKRGKLDEVPFTFRVTKDKKVFIYWKEIQAKILQGKESDKFLAKIAVADSKEQQLIMAKLTGNFKHGNEKLNKEGKDLSN